MRSRLVLAGSIALLGACAAHDVRPAGASVAPPPPAGPSSHLAPRTETRRAALNSLQGDTLDGQRVQLSGPGPVRLVELWATWCVPCGPAAAAARPVLQRHPGVSAYSLALDDRAAVANHVASHALLGTVLVYPGGIVTATRRGLNQLPMFVALDTEGRVTGTIVGMRANLASALDRLLRETEERSARLD